MPSPGRVKPGKMLEVPESLRDYLGETAEDWVISRSRPSNERLAYLAGIIDGEGSLTVSRKGESRRKRGTRPDKGQFPDRAVRDYRYHANVFITNTSAEIIWQVTEILDELEIPYNLTKRSPQQTKQRPYYVVNVGRLANIKKLVEIILPWLVGKKAEAKILLRFVNKRLERNCNEYRSFNQYDDEEHDLIDGLKALKWVESPEAIRSALQERLTCSCK